MTAPTTSPDSAAEAHHGAVPFRGRTTLLTLGVPAAIVAVAIAVSYSWRHELPDPIAVHWGTHGPDGFGSFTPNVVAPAIAGMVVAGLLWALGYFAGRESMTRRSAAGGAVGFVTLLSGVGVGGLSVQRGVTDAMNAGSITCAIAIAFIVAVAAGGVAVWLSPGDPPLPTSEAIPAGAPRLKLGESERASWVREVISPGYHLAIAGDLVAIALIVIFTREWAIALVIGLALGLSFVAFMHWIVTVNRDGLMVRSALGRPRLHIPLDEVLMAEVVEVRPIPEFGGYGIRGGGGRTGVIIRKGEAIQVHRTGDRVFVVTVDDAATGAALLNTLAGRARG